MLIKWNIWCRDSPQVRGEGDNEGTATPTRANAILPPWMLRPTNE